MFHVDHTDGKARTGTLTTRQCEVATPAALLYTFRGSPLSLTPDLLDSLGPEARTLHLDASQFLESPGPDLLRKFGGGAHGFFALQGCTLIASPRDPLTYGIQRWRSGADEGIRVASHSGHQDLPVTRYLDVMSALAPDYFAALSDEVPSVKVSHRRAAVSVDRTLHWLDQCLAAKGSSGVLASIQGSSYSFERQRCASEAARRPGVAGFSLAGFGTGESCEERAALMEATTAELPENLPRFLLAGAGTPEDALDAMAAGVDFIDGSFAVRAAYTGAALLLRECDRGQASAQAPNQSEQTQSSALPQYEPVSRHAAQLSSAPPWRRGPADAAAHQELGGKVVLDRNNKRPPHAASRETSVHRDRHTRAYIHHLLNVNEMLAQILLEVHNSQNYLGFFADARRAIAAGTFADHRLAFLERKTLVGAAE
ncbi:hypothetical protein WJX75_006677 [Coccomyxa subellipsoidea]|uniref:tRNA-guanine(15) transglycosylase-like domain-containing protein n=1 Tax=Coccomyxa subellipsoidea TaxID=248742 RepID=A0ABR2YS09_9CHLO